MPYTPYHFGPAGFFGLVFKRWLDLPVFVLANVIIDIECLFFDKFPVHRYAHTLLIGAAVGALWGLAAYPLKDVFRWLMNLMRLSYEPNIFRMIISGILGVWLHTIIDSVYHWDVRLFWPNNAKPLFNLLNQNQVKNVCVSFWLASVAVYLVIQAVSLKK